MCLRRAPLWWRSAGTGGREAAGGGTFSAGRAKGLVNPHLEAQIKDLAILCVERSHNRRDDALRRRSHQVLSVLSFSQIRSPHSAQFAFMPHRDPDVLHICSICLAHIFRQMDQMCKTPGPLSPTLSLTPHPLTSTICTPINGNYDKRISKSWR